MKRMLSTVIILCFVIITTYSSPTLALTATSGTCGLNVLWEFNETTGVLRITSTGAGIINDYKDVNDSSALITMPNPPWAEFVGYIFKIEFLGEIISIGSYAFSYCENLTSVTIPSTVIAIYEGAFLGCTNLNSVILPRSVLTIGKKAFPSGMNLNYGGSVDEWYAIDSGLNDSFYKVYYDFNSESPKQINTTLNWYIEEETLNIECSGRMDNFDVLGSSSGEYYAPWANRATNINNVVITGNVKRVGTNAFYGFTALKTVSIPRGVFNIGDGAFYGCVALYSIILPEGLLSIGASSFGKCSALRGITLPNSLESIGDSAFRQCDSLDKIQIGANLIKIGAFAFRLCRKLTEIDVHTNNSNFSSEDGVLMNKNKNTLICYPAGKTSALYIVPSAVTTIQRYAFEGSRLTEMSIPKTVKNILEGAFSNCEVLKTVVIGSGITNIEKSVFASCPRLNFITLPSTVKSIGFGAFSGCPIKTIYFGGGEQEWKSVTIASGNPSLTSAEKVYYCFYGSDTCVVMNYETYMTAFYNAAEDIFGKTVIFATYKDGKFNGASSLIVGQAQARLTVEGSADSFKIMIWEDLNTISPISSVKDFI